MNNNIVSYITTSNYTTVISPSGLKQINVNKAINILIKKIFKNMLPNDTVGNIQSYVGHINCVKSFAMNLFDNKMIKDHSYFPNEDCKVDYMTSMLQAQMMINFGILSRNNYNGNTQFVCYKQSSVDKRLLILEYYQNKPVIHDSVRFNRNTCTPCTVLHGHSDLQMFKYMFAIEKLSQIFDCTIETNGKDYKPKKNNICRTHYELIVLVAKHYCLKLLGRTMYWKIDPIRIKKRDKLIEQIDQELEIANPSSFLVVPNFSGVHKIEQFQPKRASNPVQEIVLIENPQSKKARLNVEIVSMESRPKNENAHMEKQDLDVEKIYEIQRVREKPLAEQLKFKSPLISLAKEVVHRVPNRKGRIKVTKTIEEEVVMDWKLKGYYTPQNVHKTYVIAHDLIFKEKPKIDTRVERNIDENIKNLKNLMKHRSTTRYMLSTKTFDPKGKFRIFRKIRAKNIRNSLRNSLYPRKTMDVTNPKKPVTILKNIGGIAHGFSSQWDSVTNKATARMFYENIVINYDLPNKSRGISAEQILYLFFSASIPDLSVKNLFTSHKLTKSMKDVICNFFRLFC